MALATVLTSLLIASLPAHAAGGSRPIDSNPVAAAIERARAYAARQWNGVPCDGNVAVVSGPAAEAPPSGINAGEPVAKPAAMWATWLTPAGINDFAELPSSYTQCVVHINATVWPQWLTADRDFPAFCKELIHEFGHLEGFPDTGQLPGTVYYERPDLATVPICESYRLVYGHHVFRGHGRRARGTGPHRRRSSGS